MSTRRLTAQSIAEFVEHMKRNEYAAGSVEKYQRDVLRFAAWLEEDSVEEGSAAAWKRHLLESGYAPVTINSMLVAVNNFFKFKGWNECRVKELRIQRQMFRNTDKELTKAEYSRLVETAQMHGKERLMLLMETICATGIRVSEVKYITVENLLRGRAEIEMKGKIRTILLPNKLCRKLQ